MSKRTVFLVAAAIVVLLLAAYLWGPSSVPGGQEPLLTLSRADFSQFENAFDREADVPRLVLLLSPT